MIADLKPYPAYKDSGVPWLWEVPVHWQQLPGRSCLAEKRTLNTGLCETTVLSLSYGQIVVKPPEKLHGLVPASFETYQIIEPHDIVVRPTDLQNDWNSLRFGFANTRGIITSAYMCLQARELLRPKFGYLLLHTYDLKKIFYGLGSGLRQNLDWRDFKYLPCVVPPLPEQAVIVRFLDHADRRIRRYIRAKQKLIRLLEEQKQAIIHRAVTRGFDPNVRLKPSGVEWLGDVPEHWALMALKHACVLLRDGTHLPPPRQVDGFPLLSVRNIVSGRLVRREDDSFISMAHFKELCRSFTPRQGDVLLAIVGATLGKVAIVPTMDPFQIQRSLAVLRSQEDLLDSRFLAAFLEGPAFQRALWTTVAFSAQPGIYLSTLGAFRIPVPTIAEQLAIIERLEDSTAAVTRGIDRAHREISLLREYRTRLIADVVTGKLDVREAAARLPDETEGPEPLDHADAPTDTREDVAEDLDAVSEEAEEVGEVAQ